MTLDEDPTALRNTLEATLEAMEGRAPLDPKVLAEYERAVGQHRARIYRLVLRIVRNPQKADEVTQEALTVAYRKLATWSGRSSMSTWLCGIGKYLAYNEVRKKGELLIEDQYFDPEDSQSPSVLRQIARHEREHVLTEAARKVLDPQEQEIVHLRYVENLPYEAIEGLLGLENASGARGELVRIKRKLDRELRARLAALGHGLSFVRTA